MSTSKIQPIKYLFLTEADLIKACLQGNESAYKCLWERYAPKLMGICVRHLSNKEIAKDALQDVFIKIFNNLKHYRHDGSFEGWIKRIAVTTSLTYLKKEKKITFESDIYNIHESLEPSIDFISHLNTKSILLLIEQLPINQKSVLNLFAIDGYSHKEIAELLNITEVQSRVTYHRAKKTLAILLEKNGILKEAAR